MAFMRILGCNAEAEGKYDPVPDVPSDGEEVICNLDHGAPPPDSKDVKIPQVLIEPPESVEKSKFRQRVEGTLITAGYLTGKILGGHSWSSSCSSNRSCYGSGYRDKSR